MGLCYRPPEPPTAARLTGQQPRPVHPRGPRDTAEREAVPPVATRELLDPLTTDREPSASGSSALPFPSKSGQSRGPAADRSRRRRSPPGQAALKCRRGRRDGVGETGAQAEVHSAAQNRIPAPYSCRQANLSCSCPSVCDLPLGEMLKSGVGMTCWSPTRVHNSCLEAPNAACNSVLTSAAR
jgi:hypothetical protein